VHRQTVVGFPAARFLAELDRERLAEWVERAQPPEVVAEPADSADPIWMTPIISDECLDEDECGLPSD
jgi:hypothetical protein